jgi:hypothetical protein
MRRNLGVCHKLAGEIWGRAGSRPAQPRVNVVSRPVRRLCRPRAFEAAAPAGRARGAQGPSRGGAARRVRAGRQP